MIAGQDSRNITITRQAVMNQMAGDK